MQPPLTTDRKNASIKSEADLRRKIIWVGIVAAIALAIITAVSMNSLGGSSVPVLDAVKINAELQHLYLSLIHI